MWFSLSLWPRMHATKHSMYLFSCIYLPLVLELNPGVEFVFVRCVTIFKMCLDVGEFLPVLLTYSFLATDQSLYMYCMFGLSLYVHGRARLCVCVYAPMKHSCMCVNHSLIYTRVYHYIVKREGGETEIEKERKTHPHTQNVRTPNIPS